MLRTIGKTIFSLSALVALFVILGGMLVPTLDEASAYAVSNLIPPHSKEVHNTLPVGLIKPGPVSRSEIQSPELRITHRPSNIPNVRLTPDEVSDLISKVDIGHFNPELIRTIIYYESRARTGLVSDKNAIGLMGIRATTEYGSNVWYKTLKREGIINKETDLYKPLNNVEAGVFILKTLYGRFDGNMEKVMTSYTNSRTIGQRYLGGIPDDRR